MNHSIVPGMRHRVVSLRQRKGLVLVTVMFAVVVMGVMAVAAMQVSTANARSGRAFRESGAALYAAEAGLRNTTGGWPSTVVASLAAGDSICEDSSQNWGTCTSTSGVAWQTLPNRATYRPVITRVDAGGLQSYLIVVQGRGSARNFIGGQRTVVRVVGGIPYLTYGVFSLSDLTISGATGSTVTSDSYSSASGAYNAATAGSLGDLGATGNMSLTGTIKGNATAGGTNSGATVTGTRTASATNLPTFGQIACPATGFTPAANITGTSYTYSAATGALSVSSGSGNVTLSSATATTYYFSSVNLSGGSTLTVNAGSGPITIYVSGAWTTSGGGIVNTTSKPTDLAVIGCGSNTSNWTVSGTSGVYFSMYAPTHPVTFSGGSSVYGSVIANGITASGSSKFHYDASLVNSKAFNFKVLSGSWTELSLY